MNAYTNIINILSFIDMNFLNKKNFLTNNYKKINLLRTHDENYILVYDEIEIEFIDDKNNDIMITEDIYNIYCNINYDEIYYHNNKKNNTFCKNLNNCSIINCKYVHYNDLSEISRRFKKNFLIFDSINQKVYLFLIDNLSYKINKIIPSINYINIYVDNDVRRFNFLNNNKKGLMLCKYNIFCYKYCNKYDCTNIHNKDIPLLFKINNLNELLIYNTQYKSYLLYNYCNL